MKRKKSVRTLRLRFFFSFFIFRLSSHTHTKKKKMTSQRLSLFLFALFVLLSPGDASASSAESITAVLTLPPPGEVVELTVRGGRNEKKKKKISHRPSIVFNDDEILNLLSLSLSPPWNTKTRTTTSTPSSAPTRTPTGSSPSWYVDFSVCFISSVYHCLSFVHKKSKKPVKPSRKKNLSQINK